MMLWLENETNKIKTRDTLAFHAMYQGILKGGSIFVQLTSCLTGLESAAWQLTIFCFYLQNRLIQTGQTGSQWYSDTSPFSFPLNVPFPCTVYQGLTHLKVCFAACRYISCKGEYDSRVFGSSWIFPNIPFLSTSMTKVCKTRIASSPIFFS